MLIQVLLGFCVFGSALSACTDYKDCSSCGDQKEGIFNCQWCVDKAACTTTVANGGCTSANQVNYAFDCPQSPPPGYEYDEAFIRNKVMPMIAASNGDANAIQSCLGTAYPDAVFIRQYDTVCDNRNNTCAGYVAVIPSQKAIVAVFRGSKGITQLLLEGTGFLFDSMRPFPATGGTVMSYFYDAFMTVWNDAGMLTDLRAQFLANPGFEFWSLGHSLGGAMASMASAIVVDSGMFPSDKVKMVTFGQPRTGDITFAKGHDSKVQYRFRIIHNRDSVPHIPPKTAFTSPVFHHRAEVWYRNNMAEGQPYELCLRADDSACANSLGLDTTTGDHGLYYNKDMDTFGMSGCQ